MKAKLLLPVLIIIACLLLGSCSTGLDDENLLQPPKNTGREAAIQELIEKAAHGRYSLKYPNSGEYRSAIITVDLNGDETDEAVAFYRNRLDDIVHMLVMRCVKDEWKTCTDFKTDYTEVDSISFADYNFDGVLDILAGFTTSGDINELNVFNVDLKKSMASKADFTANYSVFTTGDYDGDGGSEIITISLTSAESEATATLYDYDKKSLYPLSECSMDTTVTTYEKVTTSLLDKKNTGVVVDGITDGGFNTQILYFDPEDRSLVNYPYTTSKLSNQTFRSYAVMSRDFDDDSIIEIPVIKSDSNIADTENIAPVISWRSFTPMKNKLTEDARCMNNFDYGYYFRMPDYFFGSSVATLSEDKKTMEIYSLNGDKKGALILTIKVFDVGTSSDKMKGYSTLENNNQNTYAYKIGDSTVLYIDDNIVKENFALSDIGA